MSVTINKVSEISDKSSKIFCFCEKRLKENLLDFTEKLNRHKKNLYSPEEYIYEECRELERIVQLESE